MKPSHSIQERSEVANVIRTPLTGRRVMVPMTSKAFFSGSLQPGILQPEKSGTGKEEEQLVMHLGKDYYVEMSRPEAIKHLSIPRTTTMKTKSPKGTTAEHKRTTIKPAMKKDDNSVSHANDQQEQCHNQTQSVPAAPAGFFEIREEYDSQGREIKAEAVDVAQELQYLQKKSKNNDNENSTSDDSSSHKIDRNEESSSSLDEEEVEEKKTLTDVSNEDYDALSSRLEELARLEEEAEKTQKINVKSSKKLQSKSWGKGFLDAPKKSKNTQSDDRQKNPTKKASSEGGWGKGFLNSPKKSEKSVQKVAHGQQRVVTPREEGQRNKSVTPSSESTKKVGFQQNNQVREIPRIGQRSAADLRPSNSRKQPPDSTRIQTKPLEKNIFTGVVKERPVADTIGGLRSETAPAPRKKKLSKFAQERQMQH